MNSGKYPLYEISKSLLKKHSLNKLKEHIREIDHELEELKKDGKDSFEVMKDYWLYRRAMTVGVLVSKEVEIWLNEK